MIFVTVGTQKFPFDRLVRKMDEIAGKHIVRDDIFMQIGTSTFEPVHCAGFRRWYNYDEMQQYIRDCSILVTHSGVGTVMNACMFGKKILVVPRRKEFGEHVDDNQLEIAELLEKKGMVSVCRDIDQLEDLIQEVSKETFAPYARRESRLESYLIDYIEKIPPKN